MSTLLMFFIWFVSMAITFVGGLYLGIKHAEELNTDLQIIQNNNLIKAIIEFLHQDKGRVLGEMAVRNRDLNTLPEKLADEIDRKFTIRSSK